MLSSPSTPNTQHPIEAPDGYDEAVSRNGTPRNHFQSRSLTSVARTWEPEWSFGIMPYGAPWRTRRKLCNEVLNVRLTRSFDNHQYKYVHRFLSRLLEEPKRFVQELEL